MESGALASSCPFLGSSSSSVAWTAIQGSGSGENAKSARMCKSTLAILSSCEHLSCASPTVRHREACRSLNNKACKWKPLVVANNLKDLRHRIDSVKNTRKITDAMKLVAAAKVRKAQAAVVNGRPFSENLVKVLVNVIMQVQNEDIDIALTQIRPVRNVALVVMTGDRGLCGGFNNSVIKKAEVRMAELRNLGVEYTVVSVGKKGNAYFKRHSSIPVEKFIDAGNVPTTRGAQVIADELFSLFMSEEADKVELVYTKFVSLMKSNPVIHSLLPLFPEGEVCGINGLCIDAVDDEMFRLTTKEGKLTVERDVVITAIPDPSPLLQFEQEPVQILEALLPLYLNSQILRSLQESTASELAARMNAMHTASDNASELKRALSISYNRQRQAKITGELLEIVAGANSPIS